MSFGEIVSKNHMYKVGMPAPFLNVGLKSTTIIGRIERGLVVMGCVVGRGRGEGVMLRMRYTVLDEDIRK